MFADGGSSIGGPQELAYDIWWHLRQDTMLSSTGGTPNMVKYAVNPELLLAGKYGSKVHVWDLRRRRHVQELELAPNSRRAALQQASGVELWASEASDRVIASSGDDSDLAGNLRRSRRRIVQC